jgi:hypothetical protein
MADPALVPFFGPLDTLVGPYMEYVLLALTVAFFLTRKVEHDAHRRQAEEGGAEAIERHRLHTVTLWGLLLSSLYYTTIHHHSGIVLTVLVLGTFIADLFEFEARKVEAREDRPLELPKGSLAAGSVALLYVAYLTLFFLVKPVWSAVV